MVLNTVTVYCGSTGGNDPCFLEAAAELGKIFLKNNIGLIYGAGPRGMMGQIAKVISEGGGKITGVMPKFMLDKGICKAGPGEFLVLESMHQRKQFMCDNADAFIALPGGFGTMEELVEMITWVQLGIHDKPVGLLNTNNYYKGFLDWVEKATEEGMIYGKKQPFFVVGETPQELFDKLSSEKEKREK